MGLTFGGKTHPSALRDKSPEPRIVLERLEVVIFGKPHGLVERETVLEGKCERVERLFPAALEREDTGGAVFEVGSLRPSGFSGFRRHGESACSHVLGVSHPPLTSEDRSETQHEKRNTWRPGTINLLRQRKSLFQ